jgi:5'-nucleotidase
MITNNDKTLGGFARIATLFKQEKEKSPESTLILDAGDFLMGSLFHVAEEETGFQLNMMKRMGYDCITLGNHEFEFGPETLSNIMNAAEKRGGFPQIAASNLVFSDESINDDELQKFVTNGLIKPWIVINKNGLRIGIFGLMGIDAASVAPSSKPVSFSNPLKAAAKMADYLKKQQKTDIVIALSHCGLQYNNENKTYSGEDIELAKKVPEIDIIIGAHTHTRIPEFIKTGNTYIVQTGSYGAELGKINLKFDNGKIQNFKYELIPVDDKIPGDSDINTEIEEFTRYIDKKYLSAVDFSCNEKVGTTSFDLNIDFSDLKNSNLGQFVADASDYYLKNTGNSTDLSLVASGTIRENLATGIITVSDVFSVMSLGKGKDSIPGYPLAKVYLTGREVKQMFEALLRSREKGGDGYIYFSGAKIMIDSDKRFMKKVQKVEIGGQETDCSRKNKTLYSISANTYLLSFIGRIKKMSFGLLKVVPKDKNGIPVKDMYQHMVDINAEKEGNQEAKEWIAVIEYIKSFEKNAQGIHVIPDRYKTNMESLVDLAK